MPRYKSWEQIRGEIDPDEERVAAFGLLDHAERRFHEARVRRGVSDDRLAAALGVTPDQAWAVEAEEELFLAALARHVAAAGGRLELRAVFDDEEVVLLSEPASQASARS
jgi:DNA-binding XRE family transcriptional regulator